MLLYITEETDVGQEADCIRGHSVTPLPEDEGMVSHHMQQIFCSTHQPAAHDHVDAFALRAAPEPAVIPDEDIADKSYRPFASSENSLTDILMRMPLSTRNAWATQARKERDDAFRVILELPSLPKEVQKVPASKRAIHSNARNEVATKMPPTPLGEGSVLALVGHNAVGGCPARHSICLTWSGSCRLALWAYYSANTAYGACDF
ncbi:hypothetical protein [Rhizobium nepotum]|uniref:hypothetical protein n=1 Tax=Rhizobium nepotum TaxID=1035271 RepID=UPI003CE7389C